MQSKAVIASVLTKIRKPTDTNHKEADKSETTVIVQPFVCGTMCSLKNRPALTRFDGHSIFDISQFDKF